MDLPTVVGQQTLYYTEVSFSFTYFLSFPLLKSYRKLLIGVSTANGDIIIHGKGGAYFEIM